MGKLLNEVLYSAPIVLVTKELEKINKLVSCSYTQRTVFGYFGLRFYRKLSSVIAVELIAGLQELKNRSSEPKAHDLPSIAIS